MKKSKIKVAKNQLKKIYMFFCNKLWGVDERKIVFISFFGKTYSDNPRAISESLYRMNSQLDIVWIFIDPESKKNILPVYIRTVQAGTFKMIKELATARIWVDNFDKPIYTYKSKKQYYIQTWHGDRGFKKTRYDSTFIDPSYRLIEKDICDLGIAGSAHATRIYRSAFRYEGPVLEVGTPRNDCLVKNNQHIRDQIKKNLGVSKEVKIMLYAPTLRRQASKEQSLQQVDGIDLEEAIRVLEEDTGDEWICFVRSHVSVPGLEGIANSSKMMNVSAYEDMADLLMITDLYISDYSSSAGDFALRHKPIILFQNDRDQYLEKDRTFYYNINSYPYKIAMNQEELIQLLLELKNIDIQKYCEDILEFYDTKELGHAAGEISKIILEQINKEPFIE